MGRGSAADSAQVPSRFVSWSDAQPLRSALERDSALTVLRRIAAGELALPPIAALLDAELADVDQGKIEVFAYLHDVHRGFFDHVDPVLVSAVLEFTAEAVIATFAEAATDVVMTRFTVQHLQPVPARGGPLRCVGTATRLDEGVLEAWVSATAVRADARAAEGSAVAHLRPRLTPRPARAAAPAAPSGPLAWPPEGRPRVRP